MTRTLLGVVAACACALPVERQEPVNPLRGLDTYRVDVVAGDLVLFEMEGRWPDEDTSRYVSGDPAVCSDNHRWWVATEAPGGGLYTQVYSQEPFREGLVVPLGNMGVWGWTPPGGESFSTSGGELTVSAWLAAERTAVIRGASLCSGKYGTEDCEPAPDITVSVRHVRGSDGPEWPPQACLKGTEPHPSWDIWDGPPPCYFAEVLCDE